MEKFCFVRCLSITTGKYKKRQKIYFVQRSRVCDVLWSVAEQNMGEATAGSVTAYTLLSDVIKSFCFAKQNIIGGYF